MSIQNVNNTKPNAIQQRHLIQSPDTIFLPTLKRRMHAISRQRQATRQWKQSLTNPLPACRM